MNDGLVVQVEQGTQVWVHDLLDYLPLIYPAPEAFDFIKQVPLPREM